MREIWKDIEGYEDKYMVSNYGNVKSNNKVLTKQNGYNYFRVTLSNNGKRKHFQIHRLVAKAFIPNPKNLPEVNHKDGNKQNNMVENLEWCTRSENELHCYRNNPELHKTSIINQYDLNGKFIKQWKSIKDALKELKINNISACCRGKRNTAGGYIWRYERQYLSHSGEE